jgi:two-component system, NarL family, sensor kinase
MMKLLLTSVLFLTFLSVNAQSDAVPKELEQLKKEIRQSTYYDSSAVFEKGGKAIRLAREHKLPSEESKIYQYYGNFYYFSYQLEKAKEAYQRSIQIAKKAKDFQLVNSTEIRLAFIAAGTDVLEGEKQFRSLLLKAKQNKYVINQIEIYNGLGNLYSDRVIIDSALNLYLKGLKVAEKNGENYHQAMILNNIGLLKFNNKQIEDAAKDFTQAIKLLEGMQEERLLLNLNNNLGLVYKELGNFKESVRYYQNTVTYATRLGFPQGRSVAYLNLADSYQKNGELTKASLLADSAINMLRTVKDYHFLSLGYLIKSSIYLDKKEFKQAKVYADSIVHFSKFISNPNHLVSYHEQLAKIYQKQGDYKLALEHKSLFHALKDSVAENTNKDKLSELQVIYGKERMENELENERNKNSLLNAENNLRKARINLIILISAGLLILGIGIIFIRHANITKKQQAFFTRKLIENTDEERLRISRDLHDDIGQSLSIIKSKLNLFNSGKITQLDGLDKEVGDVIEQTRSISHGLHPSAIEKLGLERSIVSLFEKTQNNTGIVCSVSIGKQLESLSLDLSSQVYRIIQECVNNTIKHADASALKVTIRRESDVLHVKYRDNGNGIVDEQKSEGIGMQTIKERARLINGKISISGNGKGFQLTLTVQIS